MWSYSCTGCGFGADVNMDILGHYWSLAMPPKTPNNNMHLCKFNIEVKLVLN